MSDDTNGVGFERNVARNMAAERQSRGWSFADLARVMALHGYPVNASTLQRMENGQAIRLDAAEALRRAFGIKSLGEFSIDPALVATSAARRAWREYRDATDAYLTSRAALDQAEQKLLTFIDGEHGELVQEALRTSGGDYFGDEFDHWLGNARALQEVRARLEKPESGD